MWIQSECYRFISKVKDIHYTYCPKRCKIYCLDCKYTKISSPIFFGLKTVFVKVYKFWIVPVTKIFRKMTFIWTWQLIVQIFQCRKFYLLIFVKNVCKNKILRPMGLNEHLSIRDSTLTCHSYSNHPRINESTRKVSSSPLNTIAFIVLHIEAHHHNLTY